MKAIVHATQARMANKRKERIAVREDMKGPGTGSNIRENYTSIAGDSNAVASRTRFL
jgi:hypothetical protein